ncbi:MAG TPA: HEAT repeat domain-containing protein [Candidatus Marinimicrobia bacterium]|nr:HEAT repeat domain-containing protein [Candidatus Neomarinimicrobiota bacterium]HIO40781.1 HEAT repeat domain-containing protein [Candidatus Neomarinimicrobiota bacterium]
MAESIPQSQEKNSKVYTLYYAFFLIPLMITIFGVMFFFMFKVLTYESNSPYEYLTNVQIGSATKRWQSAYELSKLLSNPELVPLDAGFKNKMVSVYQKSIHDDPMVRMYLALAMGRTGQQEFGPALIEGLEDEDEGSRLAAIKALGILRYEPSVKHVRKFIQDSSSNEEKLAAAITLGALGDTSVISELQNLLEDEEPNIRWDAAIALVKLGDLSGNQTINNLLDRSYLNNFSEVDEEEKVQAILVAIQVSSQYPSDNFITNLLKLATFDNNMKIRDLAIKTLDKTYNRKI